MMARTVGQIAQGFALGTRWRRMPEAHAIGLLHLESVQWHREQTAVDQIDNVELGRDAGLNTRRRRKLTPVLPNEETGTEGISVHFQRAESASYEGEAR